MFKRIRISRIAKFVFILAVIAVGLFAYKFGVFDNSPKKGTLTVHFIDVGQGHATLLEIHNHYALIDGGDADSVIILTEYLEHIGVEKLDYVIATHYDTDHLYGIVNIMYRFDVGEILAPEYKVNTKIYRSFRNALKAIDKTSRQPKIGEVIELYDAKLTCVSPVGDEYKDENDYSIGFRIEYGEKSFLICGDATRYSEEDMLSNDINIDSDVYLVSHHGSSTSSTKKFLEAVTPAISVISVGADNEYGHPTKKVMKRLKAVDSKIYRTDKLGNIIISTNGNNLNVKCDNNKNVFDASESKKVNYVVNMNSGIYHNKKCDSVADMSKYNKLYFYGTKEELNKMGYKSCKKCNP
ncbi:MAG: MBL fold metallo-hydrolase [Lachnospiraceae bacterium]|nr:MBL fold metallo-hydrolase [Lachnospiraceae bacterium]